jgi:hypothetical protein
MPAARTLTPAGKPGIRRTGDAETLDGRQPMIETAHARVARREDDGAQHDHFMAFRVAWALWERGSKVQETVLDTSPIDVWITDSRVILETNRFERGGGWGGSGIIGALLAVISNTASHSRVVARRQSHVFAAHVQHAWIESIRAHEKSSSTDECVVLTYRDPELPSFTATTTLHVPPRVDADAIARCIADRASHATGAMLERAPFGQGASSYATRIAEADHPAARPFELEEGPV